MRKLHDCFLSELADICDAETQWAQALPRLARAAEHEELRGALTSHHATTEEHARRIEEIFEILGSKINSQECKAMQGLIAEIDQCIDEELGDAALICVMQKIQHYEIAAYGSLRSWAKRMHQHEAASLLEQTLDEATESDEHLTSLAVQIVNLDARETELAATPEGSTAG